MQSLRLSKHKVNIPVISLASETTIEYKVLIALTHRDCADNCLSIEALVVPKIPGLFPDEYFSPPKINPSILADPLCNVPAPVDLLIGAAVMAQIVQPEIKRFPECPSIIAQSTLFGFMIYGTAPAPNQSLKSFQLSTSPQYDDIDALLLSYFNADQIPVTRAWTAEEQAAEDNFCNTHSRDHSGRFIVTIPRKPAPLPGLASSFGIAKACFMSVERKLERDHVLKEKYINVMRDYIDSGHMIEIKPEYSAENLAYYMPHHPINYNSKTAKGKFRVVFNASAKTTNKLSFNDLQIPGPKLQGDLIEIFLRFRTRKFGMTADIKQMFRQVRIAPAEYDFQRILWRENPSLPLKHYAITVVSWGMTSAGFNAVRSLRQCAIDGANEYPLGSQVALNDFYFDDMLGGAHTEQDLILRQSEVLGLLQTAGFELTKWRTNSVKLSNRIAAEEGEVPFECGVLGMKWNTKDDQLCLNIGKLPIVSPSTKVTKRVVVSAIAKVYDPTGLVLPIITTGKILQQNIWRANINWDEELNADLLSQWLKYEENIRQLNQISIPRWCGFVPDALAELHIFCDSSEMAMGACAYLVVKYPSGTSTSHLITSRSKVAFIKKTTIPRLELCSAVIAAELSQFIVNSLQIKNLTVHFWSDSTITLHWLSKNPISLTPFVANRVSLIQQLSSPGQWRHAPGTCNPADLLTRGATTSEVIESVLWWHGPSWLPHKDKWPEGIKIDDTEDPEKKKDDQGIKETCRNKRGKLVAFIAKQHFPTITIFVKHYGVISLLDKYSSLGKLIRVTSYVLSFVQLLKSKIASRSQLNVPQSTTVLDQQAALKFWVRHSQHIYYAKEISQIKKGELLKSQSSIHKLTPWLDEDMLLRITGRIKMAELPHNSKHQIIIPPQSRLATHLVRQSHVKCLHGGPQLVMTEIRQSFWMNRMRQIVKSVIHKCTTCVRHSKSVPQQLMGNLPRVRVTIGEPFAKSGVDFAGPFIVKRGVGRPTRGNVNVEEKAWVVIFVCLISRAVHVEIIQGLTIAEFLAAFERFIMRKGRCFTLYSDNGTTFVGANNELGRILSEWSTKFPMHKLAQYGTDWNFITPAAPHKGGIWEAAVKSFKHHLRRVLGRNPIHIKALEQLAVQIEGCLNSRPLWPASDDPNDLLPITPADIFLNKPILSQPLSQYVADVPENRLTWWKQRQKLHQVIWQQWQKDYLTSLQVRGKWCGVTRNVEENDLVVIHEENLPPSHWCLGRIVRAYADKDGLVRAARVRTKNGELDRPITKLTILFRPKDESSRSGGGDEPMQIP